MQHHQEDDASYSPLITGTLYHDIPHCQGEKAKPREKTCGALKNVMIKAIIKLSRYDFYIIQALHLLMFDDTLLLAGRSRQVCTSIDPMEKKILYIMRDLPRAVIGR